MKSIKLILGSLLMLSTLTFAETASATAGMITGVPTWLWTVNPNYATWADSFDVTGVTSFGTCPVDPNSGFISVSFPQATTSGAANPAGSHIWAMALAAQMAGRAVTVVLNDAYKDQNGYCVVQSILVK